MTTKPDDLVDVYWETDLRLIARFIPLGKGHRFNGDIMSCDNGGMGGGWAAPIRFHDGAYCFIIQGEPAHCRPIRVNMSQVDKEIQRLQDRLAFLHSFVASVDAHKETS